MREPSGRQTRYRYDFYDHPTNVTDPSGATTALDYDAKGNLIRLPDARGNSRETTYDSMDRPETQTDPLERTERFAYDASGNLTRHTDRLLLERPRPPHPRRGAPKGQLVRPFGLIELVRTGEIAEARGRTTTQGPTAVAVASCFPAMDGSLTLTAVFTPDEDGWTMAQLAEWPAVVTCGRTVDEARAMLADAARQMIESYRAEGCDPPIGAGHVEALTIHPAA